LRGRIRAAIKWLFKPLLSLPLFVTLRLSDRRAGLVLLYHDIGDRDGDPRSELVPPISRSRFARQLAYLRRYYRFVELNDLPAAVVARRRGDPFPVALTFDDDLEHHVTHALPELKKVNAPATFFLCGSFLEETPRDYWWTRLQRSVDRGTDVAPLLGAGTIHEQGRVMEELSPERRDAVADDLLRSARPVSSSELLVAQDARQLPHIGFHTVRHDPLTHLDDKQLRNAFVDGRTGLSQLAGYQIDTIAYPHGDVDDRVIEGARKSQFKIGLTCKQEAVTPTADPLALGRYEAPCRGSTAEFAYDLVRTLLRSPSS
jgi:peptidoglycan/xylan/chitin deacetylase (PgdA/CDA1 family)